MNTSIQRQLSIWLSVTILAAGICAAATSFFVAYHDSTIAQDAQLEEVAAALSRGSYKDVPPEAMPQDVEDAERRFLIAPLGETNGQTSGIQLGLPASMKEGIQTFSRGDVEWRVMVIRDSFGERFGVAQSMEKRDEDALAGALYVLIPIALLVPLLLFFVHVILRRSFSPLFTLSREADQVDGASLTSLNSDAVPVEVLPFVQAVNRLLKRLGATLDQQRRLVADAAHELKSPVAALMVQAENVEHASLSDDARERLSSLRRGLQRLGALQDQLLNFARVQAKAGTAEVQILELGAIVRSTIEDILPMALAKDIDLGCPRLEEVRILGDLQQLNSLVRNAIDNAVRYTPSGGSVDVTVVRDGRAACFVVEDTGPGIGPADRARVFEPFVRMLGTRETGSGLGLAIVRGAAQVMGGSVELTTRRDGRSGLRFIYRQAAV